MDMEPKYLLLVKVVRGLNILDTPRPQGMGAIVRRAVSVGTQLYATNIIKIEGVPYAQLVPRDPTHPEWVRVAEADDSIEYVEVINLDESESAITLANAITLLATAVRDLAHKP